METILDGLPKHVKQKIGKCASTKELRDKLQYIYTKEREEHLETKDKVIERKSNASKEDLKIEGEVKLEEEIISALSELRKVER